jgi:signal transduction histidine kinase/ActR/RegA family two-component response regulator
MAQPSVPAVARVLRTHVPSARLVVCAVALTGLLATSLATSWAWNLERAELIDAFDSRARVVATELQDGFDQDLQLLDDLAIADQSVGGLEPGQFQAYADQVLHQNPELLGLSWVPRVADADRAAFEAHSPFPITELDDSGNLVAAAIRAEYFPVQYAFESDGSAQGPFLGFDLASNPARQRALLEADAQERPAATSPLTLFKPGGTEGGFLVMHAVHDLGGPPESSGHSALRGYVQATFASSELVDTTLAPYDTSVMHLSISDVTAGDQVAAPFYSSKQAPAGAILYAAEIAVAGRTWAVSASPTLAADIEPGLATWLPEMLTGLMVTLLALTLLTFGLLHRRLTLAAARAREEFVAMVSHDLRTPAMSLVGGAEVLLGQDLPESERLDVLATMVREGKRLNALLNDFLEADDAGHGRLRVAPRPTDLRAVLEHAVTAAGADPQRPVRLALDAQLPWVLADPDRTQQLVGNLISNARKYSPAGGPIDLSAVLLDGMVHVAVADQGLGIPAEALQHLFDPYYRVDSTSRQDIRGTGLGLAIVKGIVEAHGGQVGAESAGPGQGSRFWFTLPTAEQPVAAASEPASIKSAAAGVPLACAVQRILVVDDEPTIGSMVRRLVRVDGHAVSTAESAEAALRQLEHETFDVVLSDLGLGVGLDGWQLAAAVRVRWPRVRFVLATGAFGIDAVQARMRGVDAVLTKPYSADDLRRVLTVTGEQTYSTAA